jgi:O-antigen biosynthesis protein
LHIPAVHPDAYRYSLEYGMELAAKRFRPILHPLNVLHGVQYARRKGLRAALQRVAWRLNPNPSYSTWVSRYDTLRNRDRASIKRQITDLRLTPNILILMRLLEADPPFLREAIGSVVAQLYPHWQLRITTVAEVGAGTLTVLDNFVDADPRITVVEEVVSGTAIDLTSIDWLTVMSPDDLLPAHALYMIAVEINRQPETDIIYSDEDKIDVNGERYDPYFKPDWNPALLQSQNYLGHLVTYRAPLVEGVGGFSGGSDGGQDYYLALRITSQVASSRIRHIPHVLYHARDLSPQEKQLWENDLVHALGAYFASMNDEVAIVNGKSAGFWRVKRPLPEPAPCVSLIVPTRDRIELLRPCIDGLLWRTQYPNLEIIVVDNESREPATLTYFEELKRESRVSVIQSNGPFNFSALNNRAASVAKGELLGLINNDIEVIEPSWLEEMVSQAVQPEVGAVGAKLYYSDDTIQHGGVILGLGGIAGHSHRHVPRDAVGYCGRLQLVQDVSCTTAACLLVWKRIFEELGGFDEIHLPVAFNDIDLCLKIREAGYRLIWTPYAELYHRESASRGSDLAPQHFDRFSREKAYVVSRWGDLLERDPFHNPNLTLDDEVFSLASPPRTSKPWRR